MLSDEEKQALKVVNKRTERLMAELKIEEEDLIDEPKIAYLITQISANKTLVNLIEKQSKEIEKLKAEKDKYYYEWKHLEANMINKIEELEKQDKESKLSHNYLVIPVLQSLLEGRWE